MTKRTSYLTRNDTLGTMVASPAFRGFGHLLLPWNDRMDLDLPLSWIARLLPYHSHVDVDTVVQALNRMIDASNAGETIFFDIYSEEEKARDPEKRQTGLFCFPGRAGSPYAVIAPGGGFAYVGSVHEGFPYAMRIADHGYHAFVLRYRMGNRKATEDMAAAIDMAYTGHAGYSENDASTFSIVGENDYIAEPEVMRRRAQKMKGLIDEAVRFWEKQME